MDGRWDMVRLSSSMRNVVSSFSVFSMFSILYRGDEDRICLFWVRKRDASAKRCKFCRTRTSQSTSSSRMRAVVRFCWMTLWEFSFAACGR